jgi:hypothetical protein
MRHLGLSLVAVTLLSQCGGSSVPTPPVQNHRPDNGPPNFHFTDDFPDTVEFEQGYNRQFNIQAMAAVPAPQTSVVTVENLPAGAVFDGQVLSWTPQCGGGVLPFKNDIAEFSTRFTLKATGDSVQFVQRRVTIRVHRFFEGPGRTCGDEQWRKEGFDLSNGVPSVYFDQNFPGEIGVFQGKALAFDLSANAHAFPTAGVTLTVKGLPSDATFDGQTLTWAPACSDDLNLYVSRKRTVHLTVHLAKAADGSMAADKGLDLIAHQMTPCTGI